MGDYEFTKGASFPKTVTPAIAGQAIEALVQMHGEVRPEHLVDAAREESHPLHTCFEWDDSAAAHEYRLQQARHVIRSVVIVHEDRPEQTLRAFVNVERTGGWRPIDAVLSEPDSRAILLSQALSELRSFERKYAALSELSGVRSAIAEFIATAEPVPPKAKKANRQTEAQQAA